VAAAASSGCLSFNGNKIITAGGGGMVLTRDAAIAARVRLLSTPARSSPLEGRHDEFGSNYRLTNLQAAVGAAQLEQLEDFLDRKRQTALAYTKAFEQVDGVTPFREAPWAKTN